MKHNLEPMGDFFNKHAPTYDKDHTSQIGNGMATKDLIAQYLPGPLRLAAPSGDARERGWPEGPGGAKKA